MGTKKWNIDDLVDAGFERLESKYVENRPPRIKWGRIYLDKMSNEQKITYLERLASTMNHAAATVQRECNEARALCEKKEQQLMIMKTNLDQNGDMLIQQITKLNADRQHFVDEITKLRNENRTLKGKGSA